MKYIVVYGNPCDGYSFFGPFVNTEEAINYAEGLGENSWHIAALEGK